MDARNSQRQNLAIMALQKECDYIAYEVLRNVQAPIVGHLCRCVMFLYWQVSIWSRWYVIVGYLTRQYYRCWLLRQVKQKELSDYLLRQPQKGTPFVIKYCLPVRVERKAVSDVYWLKTPPVPSVAPVARCTRYLNWKVPAAKGTNLTVRRYWGSAARDRQDQI